MKMKFTVQKIIAVIVVAAITIGLVPKILGKDKVNAATEYEINLEHLKAFSDEGLTTPITKAEEGTDVYLFCDAPDGYYVSSITSDQVTIYEGATFTMPANDVTVKGNLTEQQKVTFDFATNSSITITDSYTIWSFIWSQGLGSFTAASTEYDLDNDGSKDIKGEFTVEGSSETAVLTLLSTNSVNGNKVYSKDKYGQAVSCEVTLKFSDTITSYPVWVAGKQVTDENKDNVLEDSGTPRVVFTPATDSSDAILTLNNLTLSGAYEKAVIYAKDCRLVIEGTADITNTKDSAIIVEGNGYLTLDADIEATSNTTVFGAYGGIKVNGGTIIANNTSTNINAGTFSSYVGITLSDSVEIKEPAGVALTSDNRYMVEADGTTYAKYVKIAPKSTTTYNIWVGNTQITSANASDVLGDGKVVYDPSTQILTLNNPVITGNHENSWIYSKGIDLTVEGAVDFASSSHAIYCVADSGVGGELTVNGDFTAISGSGCFYAQSIVIDGGTISVVSVSSNTNAIVSIGNMTINGGTITAEGSGCGINCFGALDINGGVISSKGNTYSIYAKNDISVSGGTITAVGLGGSAYEYGIYSESGKVLISSGVTKIEAAGASGAIFGTTGLEIDTTALEITTPAGGTISGGKIYNGTAVAEKAVIAPKGSTYTMYPVWVGSTQITSANASDVLGDGKVSFDASTSTLKISDPDIAISGYHGNALIFVQNMDLTIEAKNGLKLESTTYSGIHVDGNNTLTIEGDVNIKAGTHGIYTNKSSSSTKVTINGNVTIESGSLGISSSQIIINGSSHKISSSEMSIYSDDVDVTGSLEITSTDAPSIRCDDINIDGSTVVITCTYDATTACCIAASGDVNIKGDTTITCTRIGISSAGSVTIAGNDHNWTAKEGAVTSYGDINIKGNVVATSESEDTIFSDGDISIAGNVNAKCSGYEQAIEAAGNINVISGTWTLENISSPIGTYTGQINIPDTHTITTPVGGKLDSSKQAVVNADGSSTSKVVIEKAYPIWVGSVRVTESNKDDILGDGGKAKFYPEYNSLYFENPTISDTDPIYTAKVVVDQDILIEGNLKTTGGQFGIVAINDHTITIKANLDISGVTADGIAAGKVTVIKGTVKVAGGDNGILADEVTIEGGTVDASTSGVNKAAIRAVNGNVTILYGTVTAVGVYGYGISSVGSVVIKENINKVDATGSVSAIYAEAGITLAESLMISTPAGGKISSSKNDIVESNGTTIATHAVIEDDPNTYPVPVVVTTWDKDNNPISEVGGTVTGYPTLVSKGDTITITVTPNEGYEIFSISFGDGLIGSQTGLDTSFTVPSDYAPLTGDVQIDVIFRQKAPVTFYTVSFEANGGSAVASQSVVSGSKATKPADPTKEGYTFGGWYQDATLSAVFDFNTAITANTKLYAKWTSTSAPSTVYYTVVSGANGTCTQGTDFTIQVKRSEDDEHTFSDYFVGVKIDDKEMVLGTDYTAVAGSVIVTIKGSTLNNLSVGGHLITVEFKDGTAVTSLNVKEAASVPSTGEMLAPTIWIGGIFTGLAGMLLAVVLVQKKRRYNK